MTYSFRKDDDVDDEEEEKGGKNSFLYARASG